MNVVDSETDQPTTELIALARKELRGDSVLSDDALFARLEQRMARPKRGVSRGWLGAAAGICAAAALAVTLLTVTGDDAITFEVAGSSVSKDGRIVAGEPTSIQFSDGSQATLGRGAEAEVQQLTEHGAQVVLRGGTMRVSIAKKPQAAWTVAAGPYDVRVTGTAFDVSWSAQAQAFDLRMQSGSVVVTGPLAGSGITLKAGQRLFGGVAEGRLTVENAGERVAEREEAVASALEPSTEPKPTPSPAPLTPSPRSGELSWSKQVAQGRFDSVLAEAEQRGLSRTLSSAPLEDLAALAEAARYVGRGQVAKRVLLAERKRFPSSAAARDAAFFLGRIAEDGGEGALTWYERYLSESPRGPYASQALGRKMMIVYKQRGAQSAGPVAREYLSRFPNGPYAAAARKLEQEAAPAPKP